MLLVFGAKNVSFLTLLCESFNRVTENDNVEEIAKATDCMPFYIAKGLAMASFYLARCLQLGLGTKPDEALAKKYYSKVSFSILYSLFELNYLNMEYFPVTLVLYSYNSSCCKNPSP